MFQEYSRCSKSSCYSVWTRRSASCICKIFTSVCLPRGSWSVGGISPKGWCVSASSCRSVVVEGEECPVRYWQDSIKEVVKQYLLEFPNGVKRSYIYAHIPKNFRSNTLLAGLCNLCEDFGFSNFDKLRDLVQKIAATAHARTWAALRTRLRICNASWRQNSLIRYFSIFFFQPKISVTGNVPLSNVLLVSFCSPFTHWLNITNFRLGVGVLQGQFHASFNAKFATTNWVLHLPKSPVDGLLI